MPIQVADPLALLDPLLGEWVADGETPVGPYTCRRRFTRVLRNSQVLLETTWDYTSKPFEEWTMFTADEVHGLQYFSFGSNGEQTNGHLTAAGGMAEDAVVFESLTPTGRLRLSYWPTGPSGAVAFRVESKSRDGWNRLFEHHYRQLRS